MCKNYSHDDLLKTLKKGVIDSISWSKNGSYSWKKTPDYYEKFN